MIIGIGTDILAIDRMERACANARFVERWFTGPERELFTGRRIETIAGNFCCKEAAAKALGCGFKGFMPDSVEVLRDDNGAPVVNLYGVAKIVAERLNIKKIHASITHDGLYAAAFVIMEG